MHCILGLSTCRKVVFQDPYLKYWVRLSTFKYLKLLGLYWSSLFVVFPRDHQEKMAIQELKAQEDLQETQDLLENVEILDHQVQQVKQVKEDQKEIKDLKDLSWVLFLVLDLR